MGELGALFNPGMRHELEERQARAARREEEGNARDGDLRIDLDSGVAVINAPGEETDDESTDPPVAQGHTDSPSAREPAADPGSTAAAADTAATSDDRPAVSDGEPNEPAQAPVRPRGKRAVAASKQ